MLGVSILSVCTYVDDDGYDGHTVIVRGLTD